MSARFNNSSEMILSNSRDDSNEAYVEIILDIFDDSVAIHSIQGEAVHEGLDLSSLVKKALKDRSSSSVPFSLFKNTNSLHIKHVSQTQLQPMP
ncbi:hypothetical protein Pint_05541 [Pistacia integerrima]|uniref:Uncharacterized protein n=1 Tax=Pistacia integerrima TaxID=434235 RepID=A0ACC0Z8D5_9ROSI|nr:hypothetical protein Pint_05541 [Pistacia integerrima]